jgi:large subunit ribosomal protein L37Ae
MNMAKMGVRGGAELRKRAADVDKQKRSRYACPKCGKESVKRKSNALWKCNSCSATFAGGAYSLNTPMGETANRAIVDIAAGKKKAAE